MARPRRPFKFWAIAATAVLFAGEGEDVVRALRRYRDDPERRRRIGDDGELTALRQALGESGLPT